MCCGLQVLAEGMLNVNRENSACWQTAFGTISEAQVTSVDVRLGAPRCRPAHYHDKDVSGQCQHKTTFKV